MWVVVVVINGLTMFSTQSFGTEEACYLATKSAQMGRCVELKQPEPK